MLVEHFLRRKNEHFKRALPAGVLNTFLKLSDKALQVVHGVSGDTTVNVSQDTRFYITESDNVKTDMSSPFMTQRYACSARNLPNLCAVVFQMF